MIETLNDQVKCKIGVSKIEGVGVIAIRDIEKGERLYCQSYKREYINLKSLDGLRAEVKELIQQRWPLAEKGTMFLSPNDDARLVSFMNHSSDNFNYDPVEDMATKDIKKGEEVTEDYGL